MLLDVNPVHKVMFSSVSRSSREGIPPSAPHPCNPAHSSPRQWVKEEEEAVAAQYAINILRPKHDATTRERKEERTGRMASHRTPRVTQAVHSPPIPESPQTPAAKVVNAFKGKADSSIKRSPQVAKLRENTPAADSPARWQRDRLPPALPKAQVSSEEEAVTKGQRAPASPAVLSTPRRSSLPLPPRATARRTSPPLASTRASIATPSARILTPPAAIGTPPQSSSKQTSGLESCATKLKKAALQYNSSLSPRLESKDSPLASSNRSSPSESGNIMQELGLSDHSPNVSVNAPRLDLIPEFKLTSDSEPHPSQISCQDVKMQIERPKLPTSVQSQISVAARRASFPDTCRQTMEASAAPVSSMSQAGLFVLPVPDSEKQMRPFDMDTAIIEKTHEKGTIQVNEKPSIPPGRPALNDVIHVIRHSTFRLGVTSDHQLSDSDYSGMGEIDFRAAKMDVDPFHRKMDIGSLLAEVYDSKTNSWTVGSTPTPAARKYGGDASLWCDGIFYCLTFPFSTLCLLAYDLQQGSWHELPVRMPAPIMSPSLVECKGRLMLVGGIEEQMVFRIQIWELDSKKWEWIELERMPPQLCKDFGTNMLPSKPLSCFGTGDLIFFTVPSSSNYLPALMYDIIHCTWDWWPSSDFPAELPEVNIGQSCGISFEPRLNAYVF
jgi:hypothetical protein